MGAKDQPRDESNRVTQIDVGNFYSRIDMNRRLYGMFISSVARLPSLASCEMMAGKVLQSLCQRKSLVIV